MSRTGNYSGGSTIIRAFVPRSTPGANQGGALASWIENFRVRPTPKPYLADASWSRPARPLIKASSPTLQKGLCSKRAARAAALKAELDR